MTRRSFSTLLSVALTCAAGTIFAQAQSRTKEFVEFNKFLANTAAANSSEFTRTRNAVKDTAAFEEMREHILKMYDGVEVKHSFVIGPDHFDCVPIMQQPSVKALGLKSIADAPPQSLLAAPSPGEVRSGMKVVPATQVSPDRKTDGFGNSLACEENTIPMRRIVLEETTRFPTLREYFQKGPKAAGRPPVSRGEGAVPDAAGAGHKYSIMSQWVDNIGGTSTLNLWSPYVDTAWGEVFSLSQEWYIGGDGPSTQTAEVGWQNYPDLYSSEDSRLFAYWTADNYNTTGCYNLTCPGFVQRSSTVMLGSIFDHYSTPGATQYEFSAEFFLFQGNWWLSFQGNWIGYYPGSLYGGGRLSQNAQLIEFGSESAGNVVWPGEGSSFWPSEGFGLAAYQRDLFYIDVSNHAFWDTLSPYNQSPGCYTTSAPLSSTTSGWTVYFFEGGPGGPGC